MTVGELLDQVGFLVEKGAVTRETPVLSDGCDCFDAARAAVVVQFRPDDNGDGDARDTPIPHLLVSREGGESGAAHRPDGIRVADLQPKPGPEDRTFTITDAKGS